MKNEASKIYYNVAWILWALLNNVTASFMPLLFPESPQYSVAMFYIYTSVIISFSASYAYFMLVYTLLFKRLIIDKVLTYVYTLGTLGFIVSFASEFMLLKDLGVSTFFYSVLSLVSLFVFYYYLRQLALKQKRVLASESEAF